MEPVILPIDGVLDLHTFRPSELTDILEDYISACMDENIWSIRIIHGKGTGAQRNRVHSFLKKHPAVKTFSQAPAEAGGWGATLVELESAHP